MKIYYRIQPKGLDIRGHFSETSTGEIADGLHVFLTPSEIFTAIWSNGDREAYGNEIVVIRGGRCWDNEDLEGVCIDPDEAEIIERYTWDGWVELFKSAILADFPDDSMGSEADLKDYDLSSWDDDVSKRCVK